MPSLKANSRASIFSWLARAFRSTKPSIYERDKTRREALFKRQMIAQDKLGKRWVAAVRSEFIVPGWRGTIEYTHEPRQPLRLVKK